MSEMLGNHYFLSRKYELAIDAFNAAFGNEFPNNIIKKLIICYIAERELEKAKIFFLKLIKEDPFIIINIDIAEEDCPCPELIKLIESKYAVIKSADDLIALSMLWLYCDLDNSINLFEKALNQNPEDIFLKEVLSILKTQIITKGGVV